METLRRRRRTTSSAERTARDRHREQDHLRWPASHEIAAAKVVDLVNQPIDRPFEACPVKRQHSGDDIGTARARKVAKCLGIEPGGTIGRAGPARARPCRGLHCPASRLYVWDQRTGRRARELGLRHQAHALACGSSRKCRRLNRQRAAVPSGAAPMTPAASGLNPLALAAVTFTAEAEVAWFCELVASSEPVVGELDSGAGRAGEPSGAADPDPELDTAFSLAWKSKSIRACKLGSNKNPNSAPGPGSPEPG